MRAKISLTLLMLLLYLSATGQSYSSSFEEEVFKSYKKDSLDYDFFANLLAIDSTIRQEVKMEYASRIDAILKKFPEKENKAKKEKKRIKNIYDILHNTFLKKYQLNSNFSDIFKDGTYNCVTASGLYTYAFESLRIPYHLKETPTHVFLIAYPNTLKIYLETTVPGALGFSVLNETEIEKIVEELIAYKLVTRNEVMAKGYMKFYEDYYFGKEFIDKSALIGMQYYNWGIGALNDNRYDEALNNFKKARIFYTSPAIKPIIKSIMFLRINSLEFNSNDDINDLLDLISLSKFPEDYSLSELKSSLYKITEHDDNDHEFIENAISMFKTLENDKVREKSIEFLYEYLARDTVGDEDLDNALKYCDEILLVNSVSKVAKQIIEYVCFKKVYLSTFDRAALESYEEHFTKYQFLKENRRHPISLAYFYANIALQDVKSKNIDQATEYRKKLEQILDENDVLTEVNKMLLSELYIKAGNYYYFKDKYKSSYDIYKKGLDYLPNSTELKKKAKWSLEEL